MAKGIIGIIYDRCFCGQIPCPICRGDDIENVLRILEEGNKNVVKFVKSLYFPLKSFEKFNNPKHPDYSSYKDRQLEEMHDRGWNNALDYILQGLEAEPVEPWELRLKNKV